jgi:hypothetical protein
MQRHAGALFKKKQQLREAQQAMADYHPDEGTGTN